MQPDKLPLPPPYPTHFNFIFCTLQAVFFMWDGVEDLELVFGVYDTNENDYKDNQAPTGEWRSGLCEQRRVFFHKRTTP